MRFVHATVLGASALVLSFFVACSSEDAAAPSRPPVPPPNTSQSDGGDVTGEAGTQPGSECFDTTKNKPVTQTDFFNQCNSTECFPFDNGTRIEGYAPGAPLPPLN